MADKRLLTSLGGGSGVVEYGMFPGCIVHTTLNSVWPGFIDITEQPGLLPRDAFPGLIAVLGLTENTSWWVDEADWQAEVAEFGYTYKYSRGDGATTFRPPYVTNVFIGAGGDKHPVGSASHDQIQNITGHISLYGSPLSASGGVGAFRPTNLLSNRVVNGTSSGYGTLTFDASLVARTGDQTLPPAVWGKVLLCVANTTVNASEQDVAIMVNSLAHKLDIADYQADAQTRTRAWARVSEAGNLNTVAGSGLLSSSRTSTGIYSIVYDTTMFPVFSNMGIQVTANPSGGSSYRIGAVADNGTITVRIQNTADAVANAPFTLTITYLEA